MQTQSWNELKTWQKVAIVGTGAAQVGLFLAAWADLSQRRPDRINGSKKAWRAALFLNGIGPLAYFTKGRKGSDWSETDVSGLSGKIAVVTGANSGLGYETARVLAQAGATVIMACRNPEKATAAAQSIQDLHPAGKIIVMQLDLADLDSVRGFAESFQAQHERLDLLINNAGIMVPPFGITAQGFESQFGTNHLGHFALTGLLIDLLNRTPGARVVTVSSIAHRFGAMDFADLNWQDKEYSAMGAYGQSKLANLLFTYELQRRLVAAGHSTIAVAAHPGYTATNLQGDSAEMVLMNRLFAQPQPMGALPTLYAATTDEAQGGEFFGPAGLAGTRGNPEQVDSSALSHNRGDAERLWSVSEKLTGVAFLSQPVAQRVNGQRPAAKPGLEINRQQELVSA
ncbi:MAG: SDR family oxidoreductase [Caldilineaceae bacterium]|nr:SDR family oxidoreductase [Caldilineaceae bacterium]MBP8108733.1 SDR family oxidoreductase [Caldilineaceae bacterium]MBP8124664.1 SDR family oxidoreductase [Caldilineaceae bacterium]MBP9073916.1 SDR family oxidoreductase [Caldilineaceae bacterium]